MKEPGPPSQHPEVHPEPDFDPVHRFSAWLGRMGKAEATIDAYHADVADLVRAYAPRPARELLPADLAAYLAARAQADTWAPPTVRRHLQSIKAFYRYLVSDEGMRAPGPAEALTEPLPEPRAPHVLSEAEVRAIFAHLELLARGDERAASQASAAAARMDLALYGLCYHAGLLVSEAVGLTRDAVRGGPAVVHVDVVGRRGAESRVTLHDEAARWLSAWMAERPRPERTRDEPFVFIHPRTRKHTSRQRAWDRLKRLARSARLDADTVERLGPHTLRHSFAAHLARRALGVSELRSALRQASPRYAAQYVRCALWAVMGGAWASAGAWWAVRGWGA